MPTYSYRCAACGAFELTMSMAELSDDVDCPECGARAARAFGLPGLRGLDDGLRRGLDAAERSADAPQVVSALPGRPRRRATPITTDPRHRRLPRP